MVCWNLVAERTPAPSLDVLITVDGAEPTMATVTLARFVSRADGWRTADGQRIEFHRVQHWSKLPPPFCG